MKLHCFLVALLFFLNTPFGFADTLEELSVRDEATTESELQALARAHGQNSFSERILKNSDILISDEQKETFQQRLIEAQTEWLKKESSTKAIDQFLALATLADWPQSEREAFHVFSERKAKMSSPESSQEVPPEQQARPSFPSPLPEDIVALLVNGEPIPRYAVSTFVFSPRPTRVTFISNVFQPLTILLTGTEKDWPHLDRKLWIQEDCSVEAFSGSLQKVRMVALGVGRCSSIASGLKTLGGPKKEIHFGLTRGDEFNAATKWPEAPESPSVFRRPWFWGVLAAVAVGAAVAIEQSQRPVTVRPTHSEGW